LTTPNFFDLRHAVARCCETATDRCARKIFTHKDLEMASVLGEPTAMSDNIFGCRNWATQYAHFIENTYLLR
jgi:hypothetical protein